MEGHKEMIEMSDMIIGRQQESSMEKEEKREQGYCN